MQLRRLVPSVCILLPLANLHAQSSIPGTVTFQARIADGAGVPLEGSQFFETMLYDAPIGGNVLWVEAHQATFVGGVVSVELGSDSAFPSSLFEGGELWFTLEMDGDGEMTPRRRVGSVPFARRAATVEALDAATEVPAGFIDQAAIASNSIDGVRVVDGSLSGADIAPGAIDSVQVASNAITADKLAPNSVGTSEIQANAINGSKILNGSITASDLASGAVNSNAIAPSAVTGSDLADFTITDADISFAADIDGSKIEADFGSQDLTTLSRVGVGTLAPLEDLHIRSAGSVGMLLEADTDNLDELHQPSLRMTQDGGLVEMRMGFFNGSNNFELIQKADEDVHFGTGDTRLMTIKPSGDIGMGTLSPAADLHVRGSGTEGRVLVTPDDPLGGEDSELFLAEDNDGTYGMSLRYEGQFNELRVYGESNGLSTFPHLSIERDSGTVDIRGELRSGPGNTATAFAYGSVNQFGVKIGGSSNWSVVASGSGFNPTYTVILAGVSDFDWSRYGVVANSTTVNIPTVPLIIDKGNDSFEVQLWTITGAKVVSDFSFAVYRY